MAVTDDLVDTIAEIKVLQNALLAQLRKAKGDLFAPEVQRLMRLLARKVADYQHARLDRRRW